MGDQAALVGMSYLGFVQWAVADQAPPRSRLGESIVLVLVRVPYGRSGVVASQTGF
jgi:hypothetical protein